MHSNENNEEKDEKVMDSNSNVVLMPTSYHDEKEAPVYGHILTADQWPNLKSGPLSWYHTTTNIRSNSSLLSSSTDRHSTSFPYYHYPHFTISSTNYEHPYPSVRHHHLEDTPPPFQRCTKPHTLVRLTVKLMETYQIINEAYYRKKRRLAADSAHPTTIMTQSKREKRGALPSSTRPPQHNYPNHPQQHQEAQIVLPSSDVASLVNQNVTGEFEECCKHHPHNNNHHPHPQNNTRSSARSSNCNNSSDYFFRQGDIWINQFCIDKLVGTGSFGEVVRAKDLDSGESVAIKIIKDKKNFVEQAHVEIGLLREIGRYQEDRELSKQTGANFIVRLKSDFMYRGRLCLVFELLTCSLYELLRNTGFRGVSLNLTRKFGQQLCSALLFLSRPNLRIIHCDLKPENILLVHPRKSAIKIVDFGSSCRADKRVYYYIQSRFYRSPEIILSTDYSHSIDMWSLGCILVELHTGQPLFVGQFEQEQLLKIIEVIGMPPTHMIEKGQKGSRYFEMVTSPLSPNHSCSLEPPFPSSSPPSSSSTSSQHHIQYTYKPKLIREATGKKIGFLGVGIKKLYDIIGVEIGGPQGRRLNEQGHSKSDYLKFLDLLNMILTFDPALRLNPLNALQHSFFIKPPPSSSNSTMLASSNHSTPKCSYPSNNPS